MSTPIDTRLDRAQGCLLGQLAGDTLGGLVEFSRPEAIRPKYPNGVREMQSGGTWRNIAGQPTDDSEMALALARMLVRHGKYHQQSALDSYLDWWPHAWDRGATISQALRAAASASVEERLQYASLNAGNHSQANGSLMRCSPLGIFGAKRPAQATRWAKLDSRITHPNQVCVASCSAYVAAIAFAIKTGEDKYAVCQAALEQAKKDKVKPVIDALVAAKVRPPADYVTQMGWVLIALQNTFYRLLRSPSVEDGIADTIACGGDTDTNAAIAGALLGAVHGRRGIPDRWIKTLQECRPDRASGTRHPMPKEYWPCDVLELAGQLLEIGDEGSRKKHQGPAPQAEEGSGGDNLKSPKGAYKR